MRIMAYNHINVAPKREHAQIEVFLSSGAGSNCSFKSMNTFRGQFKKTLCMNTAHFHTLRSSVLMVQSTTASDFLNHTGTFHF